MTARRLGIAAAGVAAASVLAVAWVDVPVARWVAAQPEGMREFARLGTAWLDRLSTKEFSNSGLMLALIALALAAWTRPAWRPLARVLLLVALSNLVAHLAVGVLKPVLGRQRPFEIEASGWVDRFFVGGTSFPSGHAAFYWGLALPLAWAFPRWRFALLLPGVLVAATRVLENRHFVGDVLAAMAIATAVCALLIRILGCVPRAGPPTSAQAPAPEPPAAPAPGSVPRIR